MKRLVFLCFLAVIGIPFYSAASQDLILVIESYHADYAWDKSYKKGIEEILKDKYNLAYFQMDTKRLPASAYENQAVKAFEEYKRRNPVLVILGDDNALKFLGPKFAETNTPVVYLGINQNPRNYNMFGPSNITGVLERPLMKRSVLSIREIFTSPLEKILILFDTGTTSKNSVQQVFKGRNTTVIAGIQADLKHVGTFEVWKNTVSEAEKNGYDAIIVGLYHTITDKFGHHVNAGEILEWTSENTPLPPFCFWDFAAGPEKAIGGLVLFGRIQGREAGRIALKILSEKKTPYDIHPFTAEKGRLWFSRSQLDKWDLTVPQRLKSKVEFLQ